MTTSYIYAGRARARPLNTVDFDFHLPDELIAQEPPALRGGSRLLVLHRDSGQLEHATFARLVDSLRQGDLVVLNNTRVFPARLLGRRLPGGGAVECLLMHQLPTANFQLPNTIGNRELEVGGSLWDALMHPGQKLKPGSQVIFEGDGVRLRGEIVAMHFHGRRTIRVWAEPALDIVDVLDRIGHIPLPPYIKRPDRAVDRERYQTVYARDRGSIAAPTAGLHFTAEILAALENHGVERAEVTLHVGYGTFKPIRAARVEDHVVDAERVTVTAEAAAAI